MTAPDADGAACSGHSGLGAELRALVLAALDRVEPALRRLGAEPPTPSTSAACTACPVCALLAVLRGERPELAGQLAEQLGGLLVVLRTALLEGDPAAARASAEPSPAATGGPAAGSADPAPPPARRVQRIPVERVAR